MNRIYCQGSQALGCPGGQGGSVTVDKADPS